MKPPLPSPLIPEQETWFRLLFERSADAILLFDPVAKVFVDCNEAALKMMRATAREQLLQVGPAGLSPRLQADGRSSDERARETTEIALAQGTHRFEWLSRRLDGEEFPVEVSLTVIRSGDHPLIAATCRDISQFKAHQDALRRSEEQFRTMFERSADAMTLFDPETGLFVASNRASNVALGGAPDARVEGSSPTAIAPEFQPDGRRSEEAIRDLVKRVLQHGSHRYEWALRRLDGTETVLENVTTAVQVGNRTLLLTVARNIEERKRMEADIRGLNAGLEQRIAERTAELRASEERFRRVNELSRLGICVVRWDGRYVEVNPAYCRMLGYPADELRSKAFFETTPPDWHPADLAALDEMRRTGYLHQYQKQYMRKDGRRITAVLNGVVVKGATEAEDELWAFTEDVTDRVEAERALRESEQTLKTLFTLSPLGMARVSWDGRFLQVNESFASIIGRQPEEVLQLTYWDVTPRDYEQKEQETLETIRTTGRFGPYEKEYLHRDGHRVPIVINGMLVRTHEGDQVWGIVEDITERKRAEQALRASELSYRALFEASSQGVMINDEREFLRVNAAAAKLFGWTEEDMLGRHPRDLSPPTQPDGESSADAAGRHIATCMRKGETRFEWHSLRKDGSPLPLDVVLTRIEMNGRPVIQAMVTDISQRKRAEAELKRALEHERELSQLKSNFVSMVSHEFRTPLGIIQSSAEILDDYLDQLEPGERREQLHSIIKNARRMAGLMEEVLVLGRLDAGRMQFQPAPLDISALCRRLVDEVHSVTDGQCPIEFFTAGLPEEAQGDERLIRHILLNLLTNAVKYSDAGQQVGLQVRVCESCLEFTVEDRGIGMPADEQARLFEAFHRGSNVGQRPGTGLGLVIVKRCVELHGGTIHFQSHVGAGTTVRVSLPVAVDSTPC